MKSEMFSSIKTINTIYKHSLLQLAIGLGERVASGEAFALPGQVGTPALLGLREGHLPFDATQSQASW